MCDTVTITDLQVICNDELNFGGHDVNAIIRASVISSIVNPAGDR